MAQKGNSKASSQQKSSGVASVIAAITHSRLLSALLSLAVLVFILIIVVAFIQGRSISFWPPSIGALPTATASLTTSAILTPTADTNTIQPTYTPYPTYTPPPQLPTATSVNTNITSLKEMPSLYIAPYGDSDDNTSSIQDLSYKLVVIHNPDNSIGYRFEYNLPSSGFGYAGFQFAFDTPQVFEEYRFVEIDIAFGDSGTGCNLKVIDNDGKFKESRILGPNQTFRIPIERAMEGLNLEGIKTIEFIALTDFSRGFHTFTVNDVRLVK